ncbi:Uncharacterised protein [Vibrio cholerae]|nr:Uncharacterised protein [Vibrio cholerae]
MITGNPLRSEPMVIGICLTSSWARRAASARTSES